LKGKKLTTNSLLTSLVYPKKIIHSDAILYKFIHFNTIDRVSLKPQAGNFKDEELSCDWNKYSTPEKTRDLIGQQFIHGTQTLKNKNHYFICRLEVGQLLNLDPKQIFKHDPVFHFPQKKGHPNNRSHSLIIGKKDAKGILKARGQISMNCKWVIFDEKIFKELIAQPLPII